MLIPTTETNESCQICSGKVSISYKVKNSSRGNSVGVCNKCGIITLFPEKGYTPENDPHSLKYIGDRHISPTEGSNWGNIRHGKGLRLTHSKGFIIKGISKCKTLETVYDDGSNRGAFMDWMHSEYPKVKINGCEPDKMIFEQCSDFVRKNSYNAYLEEVVKDLSVYDLVYSAHTLEHVDNIRDHINSIKLITTNKSIVIFDLPNTDQIGHELINLEEYFVEKHRNSFFAEQFNIMLKLWGFKTIDIQYDPYNMLLIAKSDGLELNFDTIDYSDLNKCVVKSKQYLDIYVQAQSTSHIGLSKLTSRVNEIFKSGSAVIWGGGRLLGTMLDHGLNIDLFSHVIDDHLYDKIGKFRNIQLYSSTILERLSKNTMFLVNARSSTDQIIQKLKSNGFYKTVPLNKLTR